MKGNIKQKKRSIRPENCPKLTGAAAPVAPKLTRPWFKNPHLTMDRFHIAHRTHANDTSDVLQSVGQRFLQFSMTMSLYVRYGELAGDNYNKRNRVLVLGFHLASHTISISAEN